MLPDDREEALFAAVLDKPTRAERAAFLDGACGEDRALRARLEALLAAHHGAAGILDAPPSELVPTGAYRPLTEGPGTLIGPYKLLQQIGEGGMGVVYMAEQLGPVRRKVALKIIKPGLDSAQVIARFEAERQALAMMDHQNIAKVLDASTTASGRPYFVMELVHGVPITQFCDDHQLTPRERLALFVPVCQAIQHAHQKGIIHRDVKPSNVLVTLYDDQPVPKVIDFGVAKAIEQRLTEKTLFTQYGALVGTFEYMSPEQAEMNAFGVDTRSDVYSLGVLLYELLTGTTPLERSRLRTAALDELVRLIREEEAPRPSVRLSTSGNLPKLAAARKTEPAQLSKQVRGEVDWIVMKCLEKDRTRRYDTASGLARDVERHLADEPVEACPPRAGYRLRKFARKYRKALATTAALVGLLVAGVVVSTLLAVRATSAEQEALRERAAAEAAEQEARQARGEALRQRDAARRAAYAAAIGLAQRAWQEDNVFRARKLLAEAPQEAAGQSLRGFEWHYLARVCHTEARTLRHAEPVNGVAFNPDGRRLASGGHDGKVTIWDSATGMQLLRIEGHSDAVRAVAFSPDGRRLASGSDDGTVKVWDGATGKELRHFDHPHNVACVAFSPDGRRLASGSDGGTVKIWDSATGQELGSLDGHRGGVFSVAFSPDGARLASGGWNQIVKVWDCATGKELSLEDQVSGGTTVAFSPDGGHLATGGWHQMVKLWDSVTGKELRSFGDDSREAHCVAFSPDGHRLASCGRNGKVKLWDRATGKPLVSLLGHTGDVLSVAFSPDGQLLASASHDATVKVWDGATGAEPLSLRNPTPWSHSEMFNNGRRLATVMADPTPAFWNSATGKELLALTGPVNGLYQGVAFSPDGRVLAMGGLDKTVKRWERATGKELPPLQGHARTVLTVAFSPDGQRLASGGSDNLVKIWDSATGQERVTLQGHAWAVYSVAFSPDGRFLASGSWDKTVKVWDTATGKERFTLQGHGAAVYGVAFSPDGRQLASGSLDGTARLWDGMTGQEAFTLQGHGAAVYGVAFSPDGRRLASGGSDQTVKVWDLASGRELLSFTGQGGEVFGVAFSPDGQRLVAVNEDRTTSLWETAVAPEVQDRRAARALVDGFFDQKGLRADVLDRLRTLPWTSPTRQHEALAAAESHPEDPQTLDNLAWEQLRHPGRPAAAYRQSLRLAEAACQVESRDADYLTTLGVAHYRLGNVAKALEQLLRAEQTEKPQPGEYLATRLAFLAMARHRLGQAQEAQAALQRLRACLNAPGRAQDADEQRFLCEAEAVLAQPPTAGPG
jgi:WD40 repeat protein/serine/threonine protein kinase